MSSSTPCPLGAPKQMVHHISPFVSSRLLRRLSNSTVDRAEDVLSELWERGYLVVERDSWWKVEVLVAMITQSAPREADFARAEITSASGDPAPDEVHGDIPSAARKMIFLCVQDDFRESSSSANLSPSTSDVITGRGEGTAGPSSHISDLEAGSDRNEVAATVVDHPPALCLPYARKVLTRFVAKHRKVMSTISTVLITVGGIVLLPGVSACVGGAMMFTPQAVQAAGAIAVGVGKWLKAMVDAAAAPSLADQARPSDHAAAENVNSGQAGRARHRLAHCCASRFVAASSYLI